MSLYVALSRLKGRSHLMLLQAPPLVTHSESMTELNPKPREKQITTSKHFLYHTRSPVNLLRYTQS